MWIITKEYRQAPQNYEGSNYDSSKEAGHARLLDKMKKKGEILDWDKEKIAFWLLDGKLFASPTTEQIKKATISIFLRNYYVDFRVEMPDGVIEYHEVKGNQKNPDWKQKEKLMDTVFGNDPYYKLLLIV